MYNVETGGTIADIWQVNVYAGSSDRRGGRFYFSLASRRHSSPPALGWGHLNVHDAPVSAI